ncbi:MAG: hypothetical protein WDA16_01395 [Candidatus Thermoplasmatota archaeon]
MRPRVLPLLFLVLIAMLAPPAHAAVADPSVGPRWIDATLDLAQPDIQTIDIVGGFSVHKHDIEGRTYTATEMSSSYQGLTNLGAGIGEEFISSLEGKVRTSFTSTLTSTFPQSTVTVGAVSVDRSSLKATRVDDFTPPIRIAVAAHIVRSNADLGLGTLTKDGVAAAFAAGARVTTSVTFSADAGYKTTFTIHAPSSPAGLVLSSVTGATRATDQKSAAFTIDAAASSVSLPRTVDLELKDGAAAPPSAEDIQNTIDITLGEVKANATTLSITTKVASEIRALDLPKRFPASLPTNVELGAVNADALRGLRGAGVIKDADLQKANDELLAKIKTDLTRAMGSAATVTGGLSTADLAAAPAHPYGSEPPIRFAATGTNTYALPGAHAKDLDLALAIGATVKFDINLFSGDRPSTFTIHSPPGTVFSAANGGTIAADKGSATFLVPANTQSPTGALSMRSATAPEYSAEKAELGVTVDLKDLDVTIGKATKGDFGDLLIEVNVAGDLNVVSVAKLPDNVRSQLVSPNLQLDYLSGNAVRLMLERGLVSTNDLSDIEAKLMDETTRNLGSSMGGPVKVTGGFEKSSLAPGAGTDAPITFRAHASFSKPVTGGAPTDVQAMALYTVHQSFTLPRVQGLDTTYTVILPRGLALASVDAPGATTKTGTASDGRDQFTVTPQSGTTTASVAIALTPTFVFLKFWPLVIFAVVLLVLVIGTPIAIVVVRRGKNKAK